MVDFEDDLNPQIFSYLLAFPHNIPLKIIRLLKLLTGTPLITLSMALLIRESNNNLRETKPHKII
jgi:hypothetical protein